MFWSPHPLMSKITMTLDPPLNAYITFGDSFQCVLYIRFVLSFLVTKGAWYKGLWSLLSWHFFKKFSNFLSFGFVGGICASSRYQSFRTQLNLLPAKLLAPGFLIRWHKFIWKGTREEKGIKKVNIEIFFRTKLPLLCYSWISKCKISRNCRPAHWEGIFSFFQVILVSIFSCIAAALNKTCQQDFGRMEVESGLETLASYRITHSSHNIKNSKGLSIFGKNGNTKGFANPYIHAPFYLNTLSTFLNHPWNFPETALKHALNF